MGMKHLLDSDDGSDSNGIPEETPSPEDLSKEATTDASVAWVKDLVRKGLRKHDRECSARRAVRRWTIWIAAISGAIIVFQFGWLYAGKAIIRETVREVVREELAGRITVARADGPRETRKADVPWSPSPVAPAHAAVHGDPVQP
jgi:hypothetical protein